jgi:hypothetical protein
MVHEKDLFSTQNQIRVEQGENKLKIYGNERFAPEQARAHVEKLTQDFKEYFVDLRYQEEPSVSISSGIDSSVRFIGSPISVFKPYLISGEIPNPGICMRQDCIRTKNIDRLLDDDFQPAWGTYFPNMGAITPATRIEEGCQDAFHFFEDVLKISRENLKIRISSKDSDLLRVCQRGSYAGNLEIDSRPDGYYRHKIGLEGFSGRNCNLALRNAIDNDFSDVANLIIIENEHQPACLEISIGVTTILKELYNLDHVQDGVPVEGFQCLDAKYRRKFEDALVTSAVLFREGLRPFGSHNRNRILKKYVQALSFFRAKCHLQMPELRVIARRFEESQLAETEDDITDILIDYMVAFENELVNKRDLTADQQKIKLVLTDK